MRFFILAICLACVSCGSPTQSSRLKNALHSNPCYDPARDAIIADSPALQAREENFRYQIEFDCREAALIASIDDPVSSAQSARAVFEKFLGVPIMPFMTRAFDILKPYCRSDNQDYGDFCMATDVDAARLVLNHPTMMSQLPLVMATIVEWTQSHDSINLVDAVSSVYVGPTSEAVLLAGFIGLDDNGVQFDRLRANLLHLGRLDDYARLFGFTAQYASLADLPHSMDLLKVLFTTRIGTATLPGVDPEATKTYKAYAGLYFGCRLAMENESPLIVKPEAYVVGAAYELLKTRELIGRSWDEISQEIPKYAAASDETGKKLSAGAAYGFRLCQNTAN